jgi:hypothetical protein
VSALIPIRDDPFAIRKEAGPSTLNMFQLTNINGARLSGADGKQLHLRRLAGGERDRPFPIGRKSAGAAFSKTDGQATVQPAQGYGIARARGFAGIFKQDKFSIRRNALGNVPVVPR